MFSTMHNQPIAAKARLIIGIAPHAAITPEWSIQKFSIILLTMLKDMEDMIEITTGLFSLSEVVSIQKTG